MTEAVSPRALDKHVVARAREDWTDITWLHDTAQQMHVAYLKLGSNALGVPNGRLTKLKATTNAANTPNRTRSDCVANPETKDTTWP